jgi:hypothetical protein
MPPPPSASINARSTTQDQYSLTHKDRNKLLRKRKKDASIQPQNMKKLKTDVVVPSNFITKGEEGKCVSTTTTAKDVANHRPRPFEKGTFPTPTTQSPAKRCNNTRWQDNARPTPHTVTIDIVSGSRSAESALESSAETHATELAITPRLKWHHLPRTSTSHPGTINRDQRHLETTVSSLDNSYPSVPKQEIKKASSKQ